MCHRWSQISLLNRHPLLLTCGRINLWQATVRQLPQKEPRESNDGYTQENLCSLGCSQERIPLETNLEMILQNTVLLCPNHSRSLIVFLLRTSSSFQEKYLGLYELSDHPMVVNAKPKGSCKSFSSPACRERENTLSQDALDEISTTSEKMKQNNWISKQVRGQKMIRIN